MRTALAVLLLVAGCGAPPDPNVARGADVEAGVRALDRAMGLTTTFVAPGVVNTAMPSDSIASAIYQRTQTETNACAKGMRNGSEVDVDFGMGCTLATAGELLGGTVKAVVSGGTGMPVSIALTLATTVDGGPLDGTVGIDTGDGNVFAYSADLTIGAVHVTTPNLNAGIAAGAASLDGMGTLAGTAPGGPWQLALTGLSERFTACYPNDGTAEITSGNVSVTFTFDSTVPQTGQVATSMPDGTMSTVTLPARSGCPPKP